MYSEFPMFRFYLNVTQDVIVPLCAGVLLFFFASSRKGRGYVVCGTVANLVSYSLNKREESTCLLIVGGLLGIIGVVLWCLVLVPFLKGSSKSGRN